MSISQRNLFRVYWSVTYFWVALLGLYNMLTSNLFVESNMLLESVDLLLYGIVFIGLNIAAIVLIWTGKIRGEYGVVLALINVKGMKFLIELAAVIIGGSLHSHSTYIAYSVMVLIAFAHRLGQLRKGWCVQ